MHVETILRAYWLSSHWCASTSAQGFFRRKRARQRDLFDRWLQEREAMKDPVLLRYDDRDKCKDKPWWLSQGRETFFPNDYAMPWQNLHWATSDEAVAWAVANLGVTPIRETTEPPATIEPVPEQSSFLEPSEAVRKGRRRRR